MPGEEACERVGLNGRGTMGPSSPMARLALARPIPWRYAPFLSFFVHTSQCACVGGFASAMARVLVVACLTVLYHSTAVASTGLMSIHRRGIHWCQSTKAKVRVLEPTGEKWKTDHHLRAALLPSAGP